MTDADRTATPSTTDKIRIAALFLGLSALVSLIGGAVTASSVGSWYLALEKPAFNPPNWVFGPVWTLLYIAMAGAAWRVWRTCGFGGAGAAFALYSLQLALNLGWSITFFGLQHIGWALIEIGFLLAAVLATGVAFWARDRIAGLLFVPYAAWVAFAALLNYALWRLN